ncbi:MAG: hypothetical protein IJI46_04985 [Erysipelotrichaceae bacterium]|nr:hypothetical protein [Erysipelotrichaceae bacterium]
MKRIWSDNKYVDLLVDLLLFLTGINFLHYGQLILPVICFILFLDRGMKFRVNDPFVFVILCLFAVSFYAFSIKDFYCVMGFTLPMAYYIGSNMKYPDEKNVREMIYLLALAMGLHVILNGIFEFIVHGSHGFFFSSTHYDIWTREKISNTATAINIDLILGCLYYLIFHEKDKRMKTVSLIVFSLSMFYLLVIGRRTPIMILGLSAILSFLYETFVLKKGSAALKRSFLLALVFIAFLVALVFMVYSLNLFDLRETLQTIHIIRKFSEGLLGNERFGLYISALKLMPSHLWGGSKISSILGIEVHDFWLDVYDHAGIITYLLMMVYSFVFVKDIYRLLKSAKISSDFKILMTGVIASIVVQLFLEPVMSGASLFLLVGIIIHALFERLIYEQ